MTFIDITRLYVRKETVMDKTLTPSIVSRADPSTNYAPSPRTTLVDYPNGLPKWTALKWTTPKKIIFQVIDTLIKKLRLYIDTARTMLLFWFRIAFRRHFE